MKAKKALSALSMVFVCSGLMACEDAKKETAAPDKGKEAAAASGKAAAKAPASADAKKTAKADAEKKDDAGKYEAGAALKYLPKECEGGRIYLNLGKVLEGEVGKNLEATMEKMAETMAGGDEKTKKVMATLEENGFEMTNNVQEIGVCLDQKSDPVVAVGMIPGKMKGEPLDMIAKAVEASGEAKPKSEEEDGVKYLTVNGEKGVISQPVKNVLVVAETKDKAKAALKGGEGAAGFGEAAKKVAWVNVKMGPEGDVEVTVEEKGDAYEGKFAMGMPKAQAEAAKKDPDAFVKGMEGEAAKLATELEKTPFKSLGEHVKNAKFAVDGDKFIVTANIKKADIVALSKTAADTPPEELMKAMR